MQNQETIKSIKNYINNELANLNGEELLNNASMRFIDEPTEDIEELYIQLEPLAMEYFEEIMMWHNDDMYNNPEEYGTTSEEIEEYEILWDEDGIEYFNWNLYFKYLIKEAIDYMPIEVEYVKHTVSNEQLYTTFKVTYAGVTDEYSKTFGDAAEPGAGTHSIEFQESDRLWDAIHKAYANVEDNMLSQEEREELFGVFA